MHIACCHTCSTVLDAGDVVVNRAGKLLLCISLIFSIEKQMINKYIMYACKINQGDEYYEEKSSRIREKEGKIILDGRREG